MRSSENGAMKTHHLTILLLLLPVIFVESRAGEWHVEPYLNCQNCHVQHATKDGQIIPGGPYSTLLLKNTINELCLSCNDGSDPTAPDVQTPVQMYQVTASGESAAGPFSLIGADNPAGHSLGLGSVTPLQVEAEYIELSCASCHAVHGNSNYRNLLYDPRSVGDSAVLIEGTDLFAQFAPDIPPTTGGSVNAYSRGNIGYRQAYSGWCATCHNQLAANSTSLPPAHFNSHPVEVTLNEFLLDPHTDPAHWVGGTGEGFADDETGTDRVPFETPTAVDFLSSRVPAETNQVFCGSCHKAHGGQYEKSLLWSYQEGDLDFIAGCQQCHNK
jgi:Zn-finger protein